MHCLTLLIQLRLYGFLEISHLLEIWTRLMFLKECHLYQNQLCMGVRAGAVRNADLWVLSTPPISACFGRIQESGNLSSSPAGSSPPHPKSL